MSFVRTNLNGPIASITLDRAGGNRINFEMRGELLDAFERVANSEARVLVIRGQGSDFCLGGDVREWPGLSAATLRPRVEVFAKALNTLEQLSIPTVAAIQGHCMGGGFELALSCDLIIAARSARFAFPEALLGILTLQGGMIEIAERIGRARAVELVFLSELVSAEQVAQWNVVNRVVDDGALMAAVETLAGRLIAGPSRAYAATKALWRVWRQEGPRRAKDALYDLSMPLFDTDDVQTALRDAAEAVSKEKPFPTAVFTGS